MQVEDETEFGPLALYSVAAPGGGHITEVAKPRAHQSLYESRGASTASVERIVLAPAMAEGLALRLKSAVLERGVGELHDVERIGDLLGGG